MNRRSLLALLLVAPCARAGWRRDNEEECGRLDGKLKDIETERRVGYTARRGRRLEAQRAKVQRQRREKCR